MAPHKLVRPLIQISNLNLVLGGKQILRDINLNVYDEQSVDHPDTVMPQIISLFGPSGCGKSQFSLCLAGLQPPTSGSILVGPDAMPTKHGAVGMVAQNYPVLAHRSVLGNLVYAGRQHGLSRKEARAIALERLNIFGLLAEANKHPSQLSGGQQQRVAIIQQLMCSEHFLVLDEPLSGLDVNNKGIVCQELVKMARLDSMNTFIIVSHDIKFTLAISTEAWFMGHDRTPEGEVVPGGRISPEHIIDLSAEDLCGLDDPDRPIQKDPHFLDLVNHIQFDIFPNL